MAEEGFGIDLTAQSRPSALESERHGTIQNGFEIVSERSPIPAFLVEQDLGAPSLPRPLEAIGYWPTLALFEATLVGVVLSFGWADFVFAALLSAFLVTQVTFSPLLRFMLKSSRTFVFILVVLMVCSAAYSVIQFPSLDLEYFSGAALAVIGLPIVAAAHVVLVRRFVRCFERFDALQGTAARK